MRTTFTLYLILGFKGKEWVKGEDLGSSAGWRWCHPRQNQQPTCRRRKVVPSCLVLWIIKAAAQFKVKTAISSSFHLCLPHLCQLELLKFYDSWLQLGCEGRLNRSLDWVAAGARRVVVKKKDMKVVVKKKDIKVETWTRRWIELQEIQTRGLVWCLGGGPPLEVAGRRWIELQLVHESMVVGCLGSFGMW